MDAGRARVEVEDATGRVERIRRRRKARHAAVAERLLVIEEAEGAGPARAFEHAAKVARERRLDDQPQPRVRVEELQADAVEERAVQRVLLLEEAVRRGVPVAIVAEHGMADRGEVATDLMRAPLLGHDPEHRVAARHGQPDTRPTVSLGLPSVGVPAPLPLATTCS